MHVHAIRVSNFRRLKSVRIDLEPDKTIFVGANNSGKTSATHIFQLFLGSAKGSFQIYDFTADCWDEFNEIDPSSGDNADSKLPQITFDIWFSVDDANLHRVMNLIPSLDWNSELVGVRLTYAPRDAGKLLENYSEALRAAQLPAEHTGTSYKPWPQNLTDYLSKRLQQEYEIKYAILDKAQCDDEFVPHEGYSPFSLGDASSGAAAIIDSLIRVDFLNAQRHLSDSDSHGRAEDLSKRLSRFYQRNLQKLDGDLDALGAITDAESRLNEHFAEVFKPTLDSLGELGYPGIANPGLVVKAAFNAHQILSTSARVHYALPAVGDVAPDTVPPTLPDQYNGLGFKNLIYMVVEVLDFHHSWADSDGDRPPVHLVMVEEPEAHLHAQLQQVFIRKILELIPPLQEGFQSQLVVTTHSSHILYESEFKPIRYFCRPEPTKSVHYSDIKNLSTFYGGEEVETRQFLQQYFKLTHCDLFFADAAILVEGNVERLLLPLMIEKSAPELRACHLTILEVGGAFAHRFEQLVEFLGINTLVITDLDSVHAENEVGNGDASTDGEDSGDDSRTACPANTPGAVTSNETLKQWIPALERVDELLALAENEKSPVTPTGKPGNVRVAYQTLHSAVWAGGSGEVAGRTLEEAFALQNLDWCLDGGRKLIGLNIPRSASMDLVTLQTRLYKRVRSFDKTRFALGVIADVDRSWVTPQYIADGLTWLKERMQLASASPAPGPSPEVVK